MTEYLRPGDVAKRLGVSPSGLRRLAAIYSARYGDLPRDEGDNRLWPTDAVDRLEAARGLVTTGRARSIKEALEDLERGVEVPLEGIARGVDTPVAFAAAMTEAIKPLLERLEAQERELRAMRDENKSLREYLAALPGGEDKLVKAVTEGLAPLMVRLETQENELRALRAVTRAAKESPREMKVETAQEDKRRAWWQFWRQPA